MAVVAVGVELDTPCGPVEVKKLITVPGFDFDFSFLLNFPPKFYIPMPDCSLLKHTVGGVPEPPEDSQP
jgi:hypothetical protein